MELYEAVNLLSDFCCVRDLPALTQSALIKRFGFCQADVMVLFGGSVLAGGDVLAAAMRENMAKTYIIAGGAGHTTPVLRDKMRSLLPGADTERMQEAELFQMYLQNVHQLQADYLEIRSTNCGNNITHLLALLEQNNIPCKSILLTQDGSMQRRMGATLRKYAPHMQCIHFAAYQAHLNRELQYDNCIKGMWDRERFITLLLGEIARLRDDAQGYGPRGKNFIAHEDIPPQVEEAFRLVQSRYAVRDANPLFAG